MPAAIVTVTATAPMIAAVERQTARLETRVAEASRKTAAMQAASNQAVADAVKSGDVALVTLAQAFQAQVSELKSMIDVATATAADLQQDSTAAHAELSKAAQERDAAYASRETLRLAMIEARETSKVAISRMDELRIAQDTRANWWRGRALYTWAGLLAAGSLVVAIAILKRL